MDKFQMIVLAIAVVVLIIILTAIGLGLRNLKNKVVYPPIANQCPDYWQADGSNNCLIPVTNPINTGTILSSDGSVSLPSTVPGYNSLMKSIDFTNPAWNANNSATCNKQIWANKYQVVWDGISNYNSC
jgi:hypothetical protein